MSRPTSPCGTTWAESLEFHPIHLLPAKKTYIGKTGPLSVVIPATIRESDIEKIELITSCEPTSVEEKIPSPDSGSLTAVASPEEGSAFSGPLSVTTLDTIYGQAYGEHDYDSDETMTCVGGSPAKMSNDFKDIVVVIQDEEDFKVLSTDILIPSYVDLSTKSDSAGESVDVVAAYMVEDVEECEALYYFFPFGSFQLIHLISLWQHFARICTYTFSPIFFILSVFRSLHSYRLFRFIFWVSVVWRYCAEIIVGVCIVYPKIPGSMIFLDFVFVVLGLVLD